MILIYSDLIKSIMTYEKFVKIMRGLHISSMEKKQGNKSPVDKFDAFQEELTKRFS